MSEHIGANVSEIAAKANMSEMTELLKRVEEATDFDRQLDRDIGLAIGGWKLVEVATPNPTWMLDVDGDLYPDHPGSMYPALTEGMEAALALLEYRIPNNWGWRLENTSPVYSFRFWPSSTSGSHFDGEGKTGGLAIIAALLKALSAQTGETR